MDLWNIISLLEEEEEIITSKRELKERVETMAACCLVGKILSTKAVNKEVFKTVIQHGVKVESLGKNKFISYFKSEIDRRRLVTNGPWHFDRSFIMLTELNEIGELVMLDKISRTFI